MLNSTLASLSYVDHFTDEKLFSLCRQYGERARFFRQKFFGLLPEIYKRRLFEKKGFDSIFEFAKKLAGLSEEQVRRVLNIEKKLEATPMLHELLVDGKVSVNKLARVVSIATTENQEFLANQVQILPQAALETLVRDGKKTVIDSASVCVPQDRYGECQNALFEPQIEAKSVRAHVRQGTTSLSLHLDELGLSSEIRQRLLDLKKKGIDVNVVLKELLDQREQDIEEEKLEISSNLEQAQSRYISVKIRKIIDQEHGTKCSINTCIKPSETLHHTQRFALTKNHHPQFLAPLCKNHHVIAHSIDVRVQEMRRPVL